MSKILSVAGKAFLGAAVSAALWGTRPAEAQEETSPALISAQKILDNMDACIAAFNAGQHLTKIEDETFAQVQGVYCTIDNKQKDDQYIEFQVNPTDKDRKPSGHVMINVMSLSPKGEEASEAASMLFVAKGGKTRYAERQYQGPPVADDDMVGITSCSNRDSVCEGNVVTPDSLAPIDKGARERLGKAVINAKGLLGLKH